MQPDRFLRDIVDPSLKRLTELTGTPSDDRARILAMTICGQESSWEYRRQVGGPARFYGQFERWGGVAEVMEKCPTQLTCVCTYLDIPYAGDTIFEAMAWNDLLGMTMVRLLLWQDPAPLPELGQVSAAWFYYEKNWRPGAPHPEMWPLRYATSLALIKG